jgi:hypothetical protein
MVRVHRRMADEALDRDDFKAAEECLEVANVWAEKRGPDT